MWGWSSCCGVPDSYFVEAGRFAGALNHPGQVIDSVAQIVSSILKFGEHQSQHVRSSLPIIVQEDDVSLLNVIE